MRARRAVYIDVDAERASGTIATDEELEHAIAKAADIFGGLGGERREQALGGLLLGHQRRGCRLDDGRLTSVVGLRGLCQRCPLHRFSDARAKVDRSVSDAKRLCPAFGTTKRKGAPGVAERPHRRTAFICAEHVERLDESALRMLVETLRDELDEGRAIMDRELGVVGRAPATTASARPAASNAWQLPRTTSPFALANAVPVADVKAHMFFWAVLARRS